MFLILWGITKKIINSSCGFHEEVQQITRQLHNSIYFKSAFEWFSFSFKNINKNVLQFLYLMLMLNVSHAQVLS